MVFRFLRTKEVAIVGSGAGPAERCVRSLPSEAALAESRVNISIRQRGCAESQHRKNTGRAEKAVNIGHFAARLLAAVREPALFIFPSE